MDVFHSKTVNHVRAADREIGARFTVLHHAMVRASHVDEAFIAARRADNRTCRLYPSLMGSAAKQAARPADTE